MLFLAQYGYFGPPGWAMVLGLALLGGGGGLGALLQYLNARKTKSEERKSLRELKLLDSDLEERKEWPEAFKKLFERYEANLANQITDLQKRVALAEQHVEASEARELWWRGIYRACIAEINRRGQMLNLPPIDKWPPTVVGNKSPSVIPKP